MISKASERQQTATETMPCILPITVKPFVFSHWRGVGGGQAGKVFYSRSTVTVWEKHICKSFRATLKT